jgi:thioesterase domain-containing protein
MNNRSNPIIFLSGAGGGAPDLGIFREGAEDATHFEVIAYPGWKRYAARGFTADVLIADLALAIATKIPEGPIHIVGLSIGGHFGYAVALRLQAMGREIAGFCAIDTFMISSSGPSAGWKSRAAAQGLELLRKRRFGEFVRFLRSKFWRASVRFVGDRLPSLVGKFSSSRRLSAFLASDPIFEEELSMRLLIRAAAPWIASLDREPVLLQAPTILLRTALASSDDEAWRRRCPNIDIFEIPGRHYSLFEPENIDTLHENFIAATRGWRVGVLSDGVDIRTFN